MLTELRYLSFRVEPDDRDEVFVGVTPVDFAEIARLNLQCPNYRFFEGETGDPVSEDAP